MDSDTNSDGSSDGISILETIRPSIRRALYYLEKNNKRRVTDKYWSGLFVVIFISWIMCCQYVTYYETEYSYLSENSSESKNTLELANCNNIIPGNSTASINITEFLRQELDNEIRIANGSQVQDIEIKDEFVLAFEILGRLCVNVFTFNLSHLSENNDYNFEPAMHLWFNIIFLLVSVNSISNNRMLWKQPVLIGATFFFVVLLEHLSAMFYELNSITFTLLSSHKKIVSWTIPETIFLILCIVRKYSVLPSRKRGDRDELLIIDDYKFAMVVGVPVFVMLHLLAFYTISLLQKLTWDDPSFYMIAGGSSYVGFTIYYYGAMVISCAIRVSKDLKKSSLTNLFRALFIVAKCHFGSVCYHATLIFPRIRATFVMNNPKLKALSRNSAYDRFIITHVYVQKFIPTFTAVNGSNYAKSLKELLRFWTNDVIKRQYHHNYALLSIFLLIFLLTVNSAILLLFWIYDLDNPQLSLATRAMYLKIMFMFFLAYSYLDATSDAHAFVHYQIWLRESEVDMFSEMMFERYFDEFDKSDDDDTDSIDSSLYNESVI